MQKVELVPSIKLSGQKLFSVFKIHCQVVLAECIKKVRQIFTMIVTPKTIQLNQADPFYDTATNFLDYLFLLLRLPEGQNSSINSPVSEWK